MSCLAQTSTQWVASTTVQASTQYITSTTTFTNYPQPTETSVVQSWCAAVEQTSTDSAVLSSATSSSIEQSAMSTSTSIPSEQKAISQESPGPVSMPSSQSETSAQNSTSSPLLQISRSGPKEERKLPSASSSSTPPSPSKTSTSSQTLSATETKATLPTAQAKVTPVKPKLSARQNADSDCSWTTQTQWTTYQPSPTVITSEVVATTTIWNTVSTWVPSEVVQECTETESVFKVTSFWTESSGWILPSSTGAAAAFSPTPETTALTWTDATAKYTAPTATIPPVTSDSQSSTTYQTSSTFAGVALPSHTNEDANVAQSADPKSAAAASAESSTSRNSSASTKAGWACGTFGVVILLGLLVWFYFRRRKRSRWDMHSRASPKFGEKASFLDDFAEEKGDRVDTASVDFHHVPLITLESPAESQAHPQPPQLASRFSANSSLQNIFGLSGHVAKALSQPLTYFGQTAPAKRPVYPTNFVHPPPPMPDHPPVPYAFQMSKNQTSVPAGLPMPAANPQNVTESKGHDSYHNKSYHYRRFSDTLRPHYRRFSESLKAGETGSLSNSSIREETETDQRPTALSPTTKRFLAEAMSLPMNEERLKAPRPFMHTVSPEEHILSVASGSVYSEPEIESFPDQRKSAQSGWYSKSIFRGMFPNKD